MKKRKGNKMQVWVREAEFQEWRGLCLTKVWTIAEKYCPHCEILATPFYVSKDYQFIGMDKCYWVEQICCCNSDSFYYTLDDVYPLSKTYRGFVPLKFIELSPYDNYSFQE